MTVRGHVNDSIDARVRLPGCRAVLNLQAGLSQPPGSFHKHKVNYKHSAEILRKLMARRARLVRLGDLVRQQARRHGCQDGTIAILP